MKQIAIKYTLDMFEDSSLKEVSESLDTLNETMKAMQNKLTQCASILSSISDSIIDFNADDKLQTVQSILISMVTQISSASISSAMATAVSLLDSTEESLTRMEEKVAEDFQIADELNKYIALNASLISSGTQLDTYDNSDISGGSGSGSEGESTSTVEPDLPTAVWIDGFIPDSKAGGTTYTQWYGCQMQSVRMASLLSNAFHVPNSTMWDDTASYVNYGNSDMPMQIGSTTAHSAIAANDFDTFKNSLPNNITVLVYLYQGTANWLQKKYSSQVTQPFTLIAERLNNFDRVFAIVEHDAINLSSSFGKTWLELSSVMSNTEKQVLIWTFTQKQFASFVPAKLDAVGGFVSQAILNILNPQNGDSYKNITYSGLFTLVKDVVGSNLTKTNYNNFDETQRVFT